MSALISADGLYRYWLGRDWGVEPMTAVFVMLNPSTADASEDDATIRRCIGFAQGWGCGGLRVVNLYSLRATNPKRLWQAADPIGPETDEWITQYAFEAEWNGWPLIAAWGANAKIARVNEVLALPGMQRAECLGTTNAGAPRHPLYLRADAERRPYP